MILIDDRGGAKQKGSDYPTLLHALIPNSSLCRLDSADVAFAGNDGITVGIELKKVTDALSCMYSSRLADVQLPKMAEVYDIRYLVIEDMYRADPKTGVLQRWKMFPSATDTVCGRWYDAHIGQRRMMYRSFELWLHTLCEMGGARLERTQNLDQTASLIQTLYSWWQREDHRSYDVLHRYEGDAASLTRPSVLRRIAALLPGIGWVRSEAVARRFSTVREMVEATPEEWMEIEGIGKGITTKVQEVLNGKTV